MLSRRTLLLADDSLTVQKVVSLTFADEGMQVLTASGGEEALAVLGETVPDVLLADVHMPAPGGYELCARVKRDPRTSRVPVLLLVGTFEPFDEAEARRVGADGVLTKPFQSIRELVQKVGGLIGGHPEQSKDATAAREEAADAAAEATGAAPAHDSSSPAAVEDVQPAPAFAGLDADDESIESVPADEYVASGRASAEDDAAEFVTAGAPFARALADEPSALEAAGGIGEVGGVESAAGVMEASSFGAAAGLRGGSSSLAARFGVSQTDSGFAARPPQPHPDDSLLELDDLIMPRARAAADLDDLILDIGDDTDTPDVAAEATDSAEVFGAAQATAEASAETPAAAEISPANLSSAWSDAPQLEAPDAPAAFVELSPESAPATESFGPEFGIEVETEEHAERAESAAAPEGFASAETQDAPAAERVATTEDAHSQVADSRTETGESAAGAAQLSSEMVDAVARRVVELMSDRAVREIAWEVVPDLAERLIRERLEREDTRTS